MSQNNLLSYLSKKSRKWERHCLFHKNLIPSGNFYNKSIFTEAYELLRNEDIVAIEESVNPLIYDMREHINTYFMNINRSSTIELTDAFWAGVLHANKKEWVDKFIKIYQYATEKQRKQTTWFFAGATQEVRNACGITKISYADREQFDIHQSVLEMSQKGQKSELTIFSRISFVLGYYVNEDLPEFFDTNFTLDMIPMSNYPAQYEKHFQTYYPILHKRLTIERWDDSLLPYRESFHVHDRLYPAYIKHVISNPQIPLILSDIDFIWSNLIKEIKDIAPWLSRLTTPELTEDFIDRLLYKTFFSHKDITYENLEILGPFFANNAELCYKKVGNLNRDLLVILEFFTEKPNKKALRYFLQTETNIKKDKFKKLNIEWDNLVYEGLPCFPFLSKTSPQMYPADLPHANNEETILWI